MLKKLLVTLMMLYSGFSFADVIINPKSSICTAILKIVDNPNHANEYIGIPYTRWEQNMNSTKNLIPISIRLAVNLVKQSQECEVLRLHESGLFNVYIPDDEYNRAFNKNDEIKIKISLPIFTKMGNSFKKIEKITP